MDATELITNLQATHPAAARLARWSCLPVRISPAFLRLARLRLAPEAGTGDEADLWLSDLVESRSGAGFALRRTVREALRESLRQEPAALDRLWHTVHLEHAPWLTPRARLEEELTWRLLRDETDPAIETLWAGVLHEMDDSPQPEGVARWVTRAVPDLPSGTWTHPACVRAWRGAHLLLGDASVLGTDVQRFVDSGELAFATRRLPRRRIHIGLTQDRLLASATSPLENGHEIEVPATRPLWLQVESGAAPDNANAMSSVSSRAVEKAPSAVVLSLSEGDSLEHLLDGPRGPSGEQAEVLLRTLDGALHRLRPGVAAPEGDARQATPRPPRVQIEYDLEVYGEQRKVELPFVVGVLADLRGNGFRDRSPLADRKFVQVDLDNIDDVLRRVQPQISIRVASVFEPEDGREMTLSLGFGSIADFEPQRLVMKLSSTRRWQWTLEHLRSLLQLVVEGTLPDSTLQALVADGSLMEGMARSLPAPSAESEATAPPPASRAMLEEVARRLSPGKVQNRLVVHNGLMALARLTQLSGAPSSPEPVSALSLSVTWLEQRISGQIDAVLHHPEFQRLEGTWRGLLHLVRQTESSPLLKIRVMDVTKDELQRHRIRMRLPNGEGDVLHRKIVEQNFGTFGGEPFGLLLGDFTFSHDEDDVALLRSLAQLGEAANAPFLAAASPWLLQMESWQELDTPRSLRQLFATPEYAGWRELRERDESRYLGLTLPPTLARYPWTPDQVNGRDHGEDTNGGDPARMTWMNSAYVMAANITRAFAQYGWCARIEGLDGGGVAEGVPNAPIRTLEGPAPEQSATGVNLGPTQQADLQALGFMPLVARRGTGLAWFPAAVSLHRPATFDDDPDATNDAALAARWPYLLAGCRFMHHLRSLWRARIGGAGSSSDAQRWLQNWVLNYVDGDPAGSSDGQKALRPLADAELSIQRPAARKVSRGDGVLMLRAELKPHHQLGGLVEPLQLTARLPDFNA